MVSKSVSRMSHEARKKICYEFHELNFLIRANSWQKPLWFWPVQVPNEKGLHRVVWGEVLFDLFE